jgi:1-acyl-sn-glycerol-3-phosphate acyltransferase
VLAQRSKAAILPVALNGCYDAWHRTKKLPRLWGKIRVIYGKPIPYTEFKEMNEEELRQLLEIKIAELFQTLKNKK